MTETELTEIVACGETSKVQFKELLDNKDSIAAEMVAMANADGGQILFGIKDKTGIEIISPGCLPNSLTIENIKSGNAVVRNNLVVSFASKLMMYKGLGSGIIRALRVQPDIIFENDRNGELFKVIIERKN